VGKSTLLNQFLQQKLSIVTSKPQTTRHRVLGILSGETYQIVFLDTPGIFEPKYKLQELMVKTAYRSIQDVDILLLIVEPWEAPGPEEISLIKRLKESNKPLILAINKIDKVKKESLLPLIQAYQGIYNFLAIIPISALKNDGVNELLQVLISSIPGGKPFYPPDLITEQPERFFVSEIIREKIFQNYGEEIPYSSTVQIEEFQERSGKKDYIKAIIYVERESQKGILIGEKGEKLKSIGKLARQEIEQFLSRPVYLELWVKVREKWRKSEKDLRELGYI